MNQAQTRQQIWSLLEQNWDLIVIGGGITGAGIFKRAVSGGLKTLLLEAADFSSGTSSKIIQIGTRRLQVLAQRAV